MPIFATCHCGKRYQAEDRLAGQEMRCIACGAMFRVPAANSPALNTPSSRQEPSAEEDPLPILCRCGKKFHASHALLGKTVACTQCGASILVSFESAAPMIVQCECGEQAEVAAGMRGKRAQCNVCGRVVVMEGALKADLEPAADAVPSAKQIDPDAAGAIHAQCECGKTMSVAKTFAGRRVRCPRCNREFRLPEKSSGPPSVSPQPTRPRMGDPNSLRRISPAGSKSVASNGRTKQSSPYAQVDDLEVVPFADRGHDDMRLAPLEQPVATESPIAAPGSLSSLHSPASRQIRVTPRKTSSDKSGVIKVLLYGTIAFGVVAGVIVLGLLVSSAGKGAFAKFKAGFESRRAAGGWYKYRPPEGGYAAEFPKRPVRIAKADDIEGIPVRMQHDSAFNWGREFEVGHAPIPRSLQGVLSAEDMNDISPGDSITQNGTTSTVVFAKLSQLGGRTVSEIEVTTRSEGSARVYLYASHDKFFAIIIAARDNNLDHPDFKRFLNSIQFD